MANNETAWLVGSGIMARDYAKALTARNTRFIVIGRGTTSANEFESNTGIKVIRGGMEHFLATMPQKPAFAIVSVSVEQLKAVSTLLASYGIKNILVEKPSGLNQDEVKYLSTLADQNSVNIHVAYNRRFYASVLKAKEIISEDGGVSSFNFEFTEWSHTIEPLSIDPSVKESWALANSSHVMDLAFFLGGHPANITCYTGGSLSWHPRSAVFCGAGRTEGGALFSYHANWEAPGRWSVEVLTKLHRLIFRPLERLQVQNIASISVDFVEIDDSLDKDYKPGLWRQVDAFFEGGNPYLKTIQQQAEDMGLYAKMAGY